MLLVIVRDSKIVTFYIPVADFSSEANQQDFAENKTKIGWQSHQQDLAEWGFCSGEEDGALSGVH
jgi:hypothetical protein